MNRTIKILLAADALLIMATEMFVPLYAVFVENIGGDLLTAGWAYATFALVTGVVILIISRMEDKMKKAECMIPGGYFLSSLAILGMLFVQTPFHLFIVQALFGISFAISTPAWDAIYSKALDKGKFATEWGYEEAQTYIFTAVAAGLGAVIAQFYGFKALFIAMFCFSMIGMFLSLSLVKKNNYS